MKTIIHTLILVMVMTLTGTAAAWNNPPGSLAFWMDQKLCPDLIRQLGRHPKFKGEPFAIIKMTGNRPESRIDDLTREIRDKIIVSLGACSDQDFICITDQDKTSQNQSILKKPRYYIGIDTGLTPVDKELFVKVRAFNLDEKKWENEIYSSWQGQPSKSQVAAMSRNQQDPTMAIAFNQPSIKINRSEKESYPVTGWTPEKKRPAESVIDMFNILTPNASAFCSTDTPWLIGEKRVEENDTLKTGDCIAIQLTSSQNGFVYLFGQNPKGEIVKLFPSSCAGLLRLGNQVSKQTTFMFPPRSGSRINAIDVLDDPGNELVYAVIITHPDAAVRFEEKIGSLAEMCSSGTSFVEGTTVQSLQGFRIFLNQMQRQYKGNFYWEAKGFIHIASAI